MGVEVEHILEKMRKQQRYSPRVMLENIPTEFLSFLFYDFRTLASLCLLTLPPKMGILGLYLATLTINHGSGRACF